MEILSVKSARWIVPALNALMAVLAGARIASAQPNPQPGAGSRVAQPETVAELVDSLSREWSGSVERDQQGHVVKVRLSPMWCNDSNIALIAQIDQLREL